MDVIKKIAALCFNSMIVRLKENLFHICHHVHGGFNSMIVRLKDHTNPNEEIPHAVSIL